MKQTVANKQAVEDDLKSVMKSKNIMDKEYQKLNKHFEQTEVKLYYCCIHKWLEI